jgi:hypothetical protein
MKSHIDDFQDRNSEKELQRKGICLRKLKVARLYIRLSHHFQIDERSTGLGGRVLVKLFHFKPGQESPLPAHKFSSGRSSLLPLYLFSSHFQPY